jgi:hypothetical protein
MEATVRCDLIERVDHGWRVAFLVTRRKTPGAS